MSSGAAIEVWCVTPSSSGGWGPVTALAELTGRVFQADVRFIHPSRPYGPARKAFAHLPRRRGGGGRSLLLVAAHPGNLLSVAEAPVLAGRFDRVGAWIIDSFWDELLPRFARHRNTFDRLWVTDGELVDRYSEATGAPTGWLPWGTDALQAQQDHDLTASRSVDVLRLGRQPSAWDDDDSNRAALSRAGLSYQGRFPLATDGSANQRTVHDQLRRAKVVLASSSLDSPSAYRHPARDYLSARFTDAVANGTLIAGSPPRCQAADLLPAEALVPMDVSSLEAGLPALRAALETYDTRAPLRLSRHALRTLDWRHRIRTIADELELSAATLDQELAQIGDLVEVTGP